MQNDLKEFVKEEHQNLLSHTVEDEYKNFIDKYEEKLEKEFNEEHDSKKIENSFRTIKDGIKNRYKIFEYHNFKHKDYSTNIDKLRQEYLKGTKADNKNIDNVQIY